MRRAITLLLLLSPFVAMTYVPSRPSVVSPSAVSATASNARFSTRFAGLFRSLYSRLDTDSKGYVTMDDIDRAILKDHSIKGDEAAALYALKKCFRELAGGDHTRLTIADVEQFNRTMPAELSGYIDEHMMHALSFLSKVNRGLYPSGTDAQSLAKMQHLNQVNRGNCYFQSGFSSGAARDASRIRTIIVDNGLNAEGVRTYTVTFPRAPDEHFTVEDFTEVGLLVNDVQEDTGTWMSVIIRAYGMYQQDHPTVRMFQRLFFGLDSRILPEDITDEGSMFNDGLWMCTEPDTRVNQVVWGMDPSHLKGEAGNLLVDAIKRIVDELPNLDLGVIGDWFGPAIQDLVRLLKSMDEGYIRGPLADWFAELTEQLFRAFLYQPRDPALVHDQLKHSMVDNNLPATVFKYGGAHEAAILQYRPGTVSADGKHSSQYGFVTVRDQAWLSVEEEDKVTKGIWFREPGMDARTVCMSVEEFTAYYAGFSSVVRK
ncbi:MAG: hypothetical protein K2W95_31905, partial [Candidatus Obscuribacterales bacterium]|nr:hypothetical protein [Candidatus Obscuribacterales bacterium]